MRRILVGRVLVRHGLAHTLAGMRAGAIATLAADYTVMVQKEAAPRAVMGFGA